MADSLDITIDAQKFFTALDHYVKMVPGDADKAMRRQFRLLMEKITNWTPPHRGRGGSTGADQKVGQAAILRQMRRIIMAVDSATFETMRERHGSVASELKLKSGTFHNVEIDSSAGALRAVHARNRDSRGRVPVNRKLQLVTTRQTADAELSRAVARVGLAKSGWLPALSRLSGMSPAWVARHGGGNGSFSEKTTGTLIEIAAANFAKSVGSLSPRLVTQSLRTQTGAMLKELERAADSAAGISGLHQKISKT